MSGRQHSSSSFAEPQAHSFTGFPRSVRRLDDVPGSPSHRRRFHPKKIATFASRSVTIALVGFFDPAEHWSAPQDRPASIYTDAHGTVGPDGGQFSSGITALCRHPDVRWKSTMDPQVTTRNSTTLITPDSGALFRRTTTSPSRIKRQEAENENAYLVSVHIQGQMPGLCRTITACQDAVVLQDLPSVLPESHELPILSRV